MTKIDRISVVMHVSDYFNYGKLQLSDYQNPRINLGFCVGKSNNINSFLLYTLLTQYLHYVVLLPGTPIRFWCFLAFL